MIKRLLMAIAVTPLMGALAFAAPKTAVFPFELEVPALHPDDLMFGTTIKPEEQERVKLITSELRQMLSKSDKYDVVDLSPIDAEIEEASPLRNCNGCETDLAKKVDAELAFLPLLRKSSDTLLNMTIAVKDIKRDQLVQIEQVVIQGNTEDEWLRGVRWLLKRKFEVGLKKDVSN
jgi:Protein of unknown function (DUF2380)